MLLPCPRCQHLNPRTERICELCGSELSAAVEARASADRESELDKGQGDSSPSLYRDDIASRSSGEGSNDPHGGGEPGDQMANALRDALGQESEELRARGEGPRARGYYLKPLPLPQEMPFPNLGAASPPLGMTGGDARHETAPHSPVIEKPEVSPLRVADSRPSAPPSMAPATQAAGRGQATAAQALGHTPWSNPAVPGPAVRSGLTPPPGSTTEPRPGQPPSAEARIASAPEQVVCSQCKTVNPPGNRFCGSCGGRLSASGKVALAEVRRPLAAPAPPVQVTYRATLICINEDGSDGDLMVLGAGERILGRSTDPRFTTDQFLSPRHAKLLLDGSGLQLEDLSSLNGTFLRIRDRVRLSPGDSFLMGRQVLRLDRFEHQVNAHMRGPDGTRYMGSPVPGGKFKLVQLGIGGIVQNIYCLAATGAALGRERGDVIFSGDKFMSARHASVTIENDDQVFLSDLNSSNGTWVKIAGRRPLRDQDYIFLGQQLFRVTLEGP